MKARLFFPALLVFSVFTTSYSASAQTSNRDDAYSNDAREYSDDRNDDYIDNSGRDNETYSEPDGYTESDGYAENDGNAENAPQGNEQYGYEEERNNNYNSQDYNDTKQYRDDQRQYNRSDSYTYRQRHDNDCRPNGYPRSGSGYFQFPGGSVAINSGRHGFVSARIWIAGHWDYAPNGRRFWIPGHYSFGRANW